jgi:hypothetical protein
MTLEIVTSRVSVYEVELDLGNLASVSSADIAGFVERLLGVLPTLQSHRCMAGQQGGFVEEMRKGTDFAHVLEHVLLELEHLADPERQVYRGWTRKKESSPESHIYVIHYESKDILSGRLAAVLAVELVRDLAGGRNVSVELMLRSLENPATYWKKEQDFYQPPATDIEILWESAKIANEETSALPAADESIDLPISDDTILSGFSESDRRVIHESLQELLPHLAKIQSTWLHRFAEFGGRYTELIQAPVESLALSPLIEALERHRYDRYREILTTAGRQLARDRVPFSLVLHAVHLYEECLMSRLTHVFPDKTRLQNVWLGLDSLFHSQLLIISLAYFAQLHLERSGKESR